MPDSYRVEVVQSPAGEGSATFQLEPLDVIQELDGLQQILLASSVSSRRLLGEGESRVRSVGQRLFDALFSHPAIAGIYRASSALAMERGESLRIVLRMSTPELAALPWESMFDRSIDGYLSRREPLVRYVPVPSSPPPLKVRLPLRILVLIASPRGLAQLDIEKERANLTLALGPLIKDGKVAVRWLEHTTWQALQDALLTESWHVVHFIGHGDFDIERDEGAIALETEQGWQHRVPPDSLVDLLREAQPMPRLVVLNACESSTSGTTDLFSGTAASLVRGGVCAVTAMQFEISDRAAIAFCGGFYKAIARGRGIDEAVRSGRVAIVGLDSSCLEWITPTLFLRGQENHLFALSKSPSESMPEPILAEHRRQVADASRDSGTAAAVPLSDSVLAETPDDEAALREREPVAASAREVTGQTEVPIRDRYPDRYSELWAIAKRIEWGSRPFKAGLKPLRKALRPDEQIIGCVRMDVPGVFKEIVAVVTNQNLHLCAWSQFEELEEVSELVWSVWSDWSSLVSKLPERYRPTNDRLLIPRDDIDGPLAFVNGCAELAIRGSGTNVRIRISTTKTRADLLRAYLQKADE